MSGKKAGLLIGGLVFAIALILLMVRGAIVKKKTAELEQEQIAVEESYMQYQDGNQMGNVSTNDQGMTTWGNGGTMQQNMPVDASVLDEVNERQDSVSDLPVDVNQDSGDVPPTTDEVNTNLSLELIDKVEIVNTYEANVLVSSKNIYKVNDSCYAYALSMIIPVEGKGYQLIDYLCSVATWNSVSSGDSIVVTYGLDENGVVVIKGLSK